MVYFLDAALFVDVWALSFILQFLEFKIFGPLSDKTLRDIQVVCYLSYGSFSAPGLITKYLVHLFVVPSGHTLIKATYW